MSVGFFKIDNEFVDGGSLAAIGGTEAKVMFVLMRFRSSDNIAFPSLRTLARLAGANRGTVSRAVTSLVESGHIERVELGKSRKSSTRYRITNGCAGATVKSETVALAQHNGCAGATPTVALAHTNGCAGAALNRHIDKDHLEIDKQTTAAAPLVVPDGVRILKENTKLLQLAGLNGRNLLEVAQTPGLCSIHVLQTILKSRSLLAEGKVHSPQGWIVKQLREITPRSIIDTGECCRLINAGWIVAINDTPVHRGAKYNSTGLHIGDKVILSPIRAMYISVATDEPVSASVDLANMNRELAEQAEQLERQFNRPRSGKVAS